MKKYLLIIVSCILAFVFLTGCQQGLWDALVNNSTAAADLGSGSNQQAKNKNTDKSENRLERSLKVDIASLKGNDGQPLLIPPEAKLIPSRPENPGLLPLTDPLHWFDAEYAGWMSEKINIPDSPADGAEGKKIIMIVTVDHPYFSAVSIGAKKVADAYGMSFKMYCAHSSLDKQNQLINKAISEKPDMILFASLDAKEAISQLESINQAGIPVIAFNTIPDSEALKYCLAWSGPDDWGVMRMLARTLADKLDKKGGIAFLTHIQGGSPYYSRTYGLISELAGYAPDIKTLDIQSPGFDREKSRQAVEAMIDKYGHNLNAIVCAEDTFQVLGAVDAVKARNRTDITIVCAGNSKVNMNAVKEGELFAVTYQSAEGDGAMPVKLAADWFNGLGIPSVAYLAKRVITRDNVDKYMPAQF